MASALFWLSDGEWAKIEPLMPRGRRGAHRVDDRRVISGIVHMLRSGARWRDCPPAYGPYTTIYNRFNRWSRQGIWFEMFEALTGSTGSSERFRSTARQSRPTARQPVEKGGVRRSHRPLARRTHDKDPRADRCCGTPSRSSAQPRQRPRRRDGARVGRGGGVDQQTSRRQSL